VAQLTEAGLALITGSTTVGTYPAVFKPVICALNSADVKSAN